MKRIKYKSGQLVGSAIFFSDLADHVAPNGRRFRRALFECTVCGEYMFPALIMNVKSGKIQSCGCKKTDANIAKNTVHGLSNHPLYQTWKGIKARCMNPNKDDYKYYGGRGITICDEWKGNFSAFYHHVSNLPHYGERGMTLDREKNSEGYYPGNVRWVDMKTQRANQG